MPGRHRDPAAIRQRRTRRLHLASRRAPVRQAPERLPVRHHRQRRALPRHGKQSRVAAEPGRTAGLPAEQATASDPLPPTDGRAARAGRMKPVHTRARTALLQITGARTSFQPRLPV